MKAIILLALISLPALACLGPDMETHTFLEKLPAQAMKKSLVAEVEILASEKTTGKLLAQVKVRKAYKGTKAGASLSINVELHSCSREPTLKKGATFFIAGEMGKDGKFRGDWSDHALEKE